MKKSLFIEVTLVRVFVIIIQLVFLKVYTKYVSVYELGIYYFLVTISYSLNAFLFVPLDYFQQSQLYKLKNEGYSLRSFFGINKLVLYFSGIVLCISLVICFLIKREYCYLVPLVVLLATNLYFVTLIRGFINNLEKRRTAIYTVLLENAFKIGIFFLLIKLFKPSAVIILGSTVCASLLILVILLFIIKKLPEYKVSQLLDFKLKDIFVFSYPLTISSVINWIQIQGYRMILVPLGLVEVVGIYGTVSGVGANSMLSYSTIFSQMFVPVLYKTKGFYIKTYLRNGLLSIIVILIGGYFISGLLVGLLTKHEFVAYSSIMLYGILSEGGSMLIGPLMIFLTLYNKTNNLIKVYMAGLVSFLVSFLVIYLLKKINVYTIGIPIVLTQVVVIVYLYTIVNKLLKEQK